MQSCFNQRQIRNIQESVPLNSKDQKSIKYTGKAKAQVKEED